MARLPWENNGGGCSSAGTNMAFNKIMFIISIFFMVFLFAGLIYADNCTIEQRAALAKAGYNKEEIEQLCNPNSFIDDQNSSANTVHEPYQNYYTADQIFNQMASVYRTCSSYSDSGEQNTTYFDSGKTKKLTFATAFVRPGDFCFVYEYLSNGRLERYSILGSDNKVKTHWTKTGTEQPSSLDLAVAGATGISGGTSHTIPRLLMPSKISGWSITELQEPINIGDAYVNGSECFRLEGRDGLGFRISLWIDKATFLLLRIEEKSDLAKRQTNYSPEIDISIPKGLFNF